MCREVSLFAEGYVLSRRRSGRSRRSFFIVPIVVVIVLAVGAGAWWVMTQKARTGDTRYSKAKLDYEAGQFAAAEQELTQLVKSSPDNLEARRTLALALAAQGKNPEAIEQYGKIVEAEPKDHASWYRMALLERIVGQSKQSEEHLQQALAAKSGDPTYTDELARTKMALGDFTGAAKLWGDLADSGKLAKEGRASILVLQGQAYLEAKDYVQAKKAFEAALKLNPGDQALQARVKSFD